MRKSVAQQKPLFQSIFIFTFSICKYNRTKKAKNNKQQILNKSKDIVKEKNLDVH